MNLPNFKIRISKYLSPILPTYYYPLSYKCSYIFRYSLLFSQIIIPTDAVVYIYRLLIILILVCTYTPSMPLPFYRISYIPNYYAVFLLFPINYLSSLQLQTLFYYFQIPHILFPYYIYTYVFLSLLPNNIFMYFINFLYDQLW